jgi:hypothetical protein
MYKLVHMYMFIYVINLRKVDISKKISMDMQYEDKNV